MRDYRAPVPHVLALNVGSSSLRLASYLLDESPRRIADAHLSPVPASDASVLVDFVAQNAMPAPTIVVHRVVHGGGNLGDPCVIDAGVEAEIDRLRALAPLHNGLALEWVRAARAAIGPDVLEVACFDTGFYKTLPAPAARYALPDEFADKHQVRRYGFHGLAHQSMLDRWRSKGRGKSGRRVISLQLGAGCSITATERGRPVETSMGFSPLEGLMMATRCGDLDAAAVLYLIENCGFSAADLRLVLNESSGLQAVSGQSADMKVLLESGTKAAALAVAMFCHRVRHYLGAYLVALGGADAILFGGGIGEHAPEIRARVLDQLDWAGIRLDNERNDSVPAGRCRPIHADGSDVEVWVTPTEEERVMALAAYALQSQSNSFRSAATEDNR